MLSLQQPGGALSAALGFSLSSAVRGPLVGIEQGSPAGDGHIKYHQDEPHRHNVEAKKADTSVPAARFYLRKDCDRRS